MSRSKHKITNSATLPLAAACAYLLGLFLLVMDRYFLGILFVVAGIAGGSYAAVKAIRNTYRPSRSGDLRWRRFIAPLVKASSRQNFRN